jgi:hypothetical protein
MSYQLIERPHKQVFSGNPIRYVFNVSNPEAPGCAMEVALFVLDIGADPFSPGTLVTQQTLYPNPDGKVYYYCEDYLNSQLDWQLPSLANDDVIGVTKQIKRFYIEYRQVTRANSSPQWSSEQPHSRVVLKGGVAKEKFDRNNFFINYLPNKTPFLTWLPDKHFIGLEERRYLTWFHFYDDPMVHITPMLKARVVYTDGVQEEITKPFPSLNTTLLFHCPAGLKQLGLDNLHPDKQIWYYDVQVVDADGGFDVSAPYRMYADYRMVYDPFSFTYHNSLGGMDTMRMRGDFDTEVTLFGSDIQKATGGDFSNEVLPVENDYVNISGYKTYDGDAGWQNTAAMREAMEDILYSDGVYRELFGRWLKVDVLTKSQKGPAKTDTKWSFPIKWRYTYDNTQFTPFGKDFGAGVMDEPAGTLFGICTAPINLAADKTDDQQAQQTWQLSWNPVADALGYQLEVTDPNGAVTVHDLTDPNFGVVATVEGDYSWRVRTKCGLNDYSFYANGPGFNVDFIAAFCASPTTLAIVLLSLNGNQADIKFTWDAVPGVYGYWVEWREVGSSVWSSGFQTITNRPVTLSADVQYEWRVRSQCDNSGILHASGYIYGGAFIPSNLVGTCSAPTNLWAVIVASSLIYSSVQFTWTPAANVTDYELQFRSGTSPTWTTINHKESGYIDLFMFGQDWEWRIRSNCNSGGQSNFVNGNNFST